MIFVGDIALFDEEGISFEGIPPSLCNEDWVINLEGALIVGKSDVGVYNNIKGFESLISDLPIKVVCLANNHITDVGSISETKKYLRRKNIDFVGAGSSLNDAKKPLVLEKAVILNFGWPIIHCIPAKKDKAGVNPLKKSEVIKQFIEAKSKYPNKKIIVIFHWNYELEIMPMPAHRVLAQKLITIGAELVIGHHSHIVQGVEKYKGKYIVHGLGNWAFQQNKYFDRKLSFPASSTKQLAFEYSLKTNEGKCHLFTYDINSNKVVYKESFEVDQYIDMLGLRYKDLSKKSYKSFFKKNRLKKKFLPIYYFDDSELSIFCKNYYMKLRDLFIKLLLKLKVKKM